MYLFIANYVLNINTIHQGLGDDQSITHTQYNNILDMLYF